MTDLQIIKVGKQNTIDSRQVAQMVEKQHKNLLRDIAGYIETMRKNTELKIEPSDFFIEASYQDITGRTLPCYMLTKKGCEMVANKMTGEKGVLFTAAYVTAFNKMEEHLKEEAVDMTQLSPEMQMLKLLIDKAIATELAQKQQEQHLQLVEQKVEGIRELVGINPNQWREDCRRLIVRIANRMGGNEYIRDVNAEVFQQVDERAGVSLATRLTNKRRRMADEGVCKSKRDRLTKVDVIAEVRKLVEIYIKVVRELEVRYEVV